MFIILELLLIHYVKLLIISYVYTNDKVKQTIDKKLLPLCVCVCVVTLKNLLLNNIFLASRASNIQHSFPLWI